MSMEAALLESRTLRAGMCERVEALDKVKVLTVLPDGVHVTTRMVAGYFEVPVEAVKSLIKDHREELESSGYRVLAGQELMSFKDLSRRGQGSFEDLSRIGTRTRSLALFPKRAVLNVAMLLRDSEVARQVRSALLDVAAAAWRPEPEPEPEVTYFRARPYRRWNELHWDEYEALRRDPEAEAWRRRIDGEEPFEGEDGSGERLSAIEQRLGTHTRVIVALGERLCRQGEDLRAIRADIANLRGRRHR